MGIKFDDPLSMVLQERRFQPPIVLIVSPYPYRFFKWIDARIATAYRPNIAVYPEGHRMSNS
jgi:hypothetical protein